MNRPAPVRLADVAREAKVSLGTASNVFAHPERVREEVRQRVEVAARTLGYAGPDPKGRLLRGGKFNSIGIVPPSDFGVADALRNPVFATFVLGVAEVCDERGANLVILSDKAHGRGIHTALVDGFILGRVEHLREIEPARRRRLPFALVDFDAGPAIGSVRVDARAGGYLAARHLTDLGHRHFAILSFRRDFGPAKVYPPGAPRPPEAAGMPIDQEKLAGYAQALEEVGIRIADVPMVQAHPWDAAAAPLLLDLAPDATAILSMAAMQAIAAIDEARRRGRDVPGTLSVVGFNDVPDALRCRPPLTTVDGMNAEKGRVAARMVFDGGPVRQQVLGTRLIERGSTAAPPAS